jgi:tetratricopeptide (TPR) repeat protein/tRNA A-37 threonylcarbamoyl transferase component Bud32
MGLASATRLGPYEILSPLGAGGMGEVYRARDPRLGREVAVKILPERVANDPRRLKRFEHEARAAGSLNHPNILAVYDVGSQDGKPYVVTELLEGEPLSQRMRGVQLPVRKTLSFGVQIAHGLAAAHDKGVVHRDLKPDNLFVTKDGLVKILDFGLAKLQEPQEPVAGSADTTEAPPLTDPGTVLGTTGYMSPEHVRGQGVDHRSDIFSLGVVLYEALAGRRPFRASSPAETMAAILKEDPAPLGVTNAEVPEAVDRVVRRCLEKRPEERFQSARDVAFALEALSDSRERPPLPRRPVVAGRARRAAAVGLVVLAIGLGGLKLAARQKAPVAALPAKAHVAVLQLQSGSEADTTFANGLTETLAASLVALERQTHGDLWVLPRDIAKTRDPARLAELARLHGVTLGVGGRVERGEGRLRLTLTLTDPTTGRELRSSTIDDQQGNLAALQAEPVRRVAQILQLEAGPEVVQTLQARSTNVVAALDVYLIGLGLLADASDATTIDKAATSLRSAVDLDPLFAPARVALARACLAKLEATHEEKWREEGLKQSAKAADLGMGAEAHLVAAAIQRSAGRQQEAIASLERAVQADPENAEAQMARGRAYQDMGRLDDAETSLQRAIYLRPGFWVGHHWLARLYLRRGADAAAATQFRLVVDATPENYRGYNNLGMAISRLGRRQEAQQMFEKSLQLERGDNFHAFSNLGTLYYQDARFADAIAMFERATKLREGEYLAWGNLGYAYFFGGQAEQAAGCFRRAIALAEEARKKGPQDPARLCDLSGYLAAVGNRAAGLELVQRVVANPPHPPELVANIAETYEHLGQRERALDWVGRAFASGVPPARFERQPTLRGLLADERFRRLVDMTKTAASAARKGG